MYILNVWHLYHWNEPEGVLIPYLVFLSGYHISLQIPWQHRSVSGAGSVASLSCLPASLAHGCPSCCGCREKGGVMIKSVCVVHVCAHVYV